MLSLLKPFFWSKQYALYAWLMLIFLLSLGWYQVQLLTILNEWNRELYDAIQTLQEERFWILFIGWDFERLWQMITLKEDVIPSFLELLSVYVPIAAYTGWQIQRAVFKWRESNTLSFLRRWEKSKMTIEGGSQRLQSDLQMAGRSVQSLFFGFTLGLFVLYAFIPILWELSAGLPVWNGAIIDGFLVWTVLIVAFGGTFASVLFGWKLPKLEYNNEIVEAVFRKRLVHAEDNFAMRGIAELFPMFYAIKRNYYKLFNAYFKFGLWQSLFGLCVGNFALVILAPSYFDQLITLGILFQALNAFSRVESSLSFFVDRYQQIVDLIAVVKRIGEFDAELKLEEKAR